MPKTFERVHHYVYRRDGKVHFYKVGNEVYAGDRDGRGHGSPDSGEPVIFTHATGGCGHTWDKCIDYFAEYFTCYVLDCPGHDDSDIPASKYSMPDYADAILEVADVIGLKKFNIVADHTGSMYSMDLAIRYPDRVKRMVLDGLPYWRAENSGVIWDKFFIPSFTDADAYHVNVVPLLSWEEAKSRRPNITREEWEHSEWQHKRNRLWTRYGQEANTSYDTESMGPKVNTSTLLIYGEADILRRGEQKAHRDIKDSILRVVPGGPGPAHSGAPAEFAKLGIAFLNGEPLPDIGYAPSQDAPK
jgi:pimeloyl-ACP methyl ester carboxylesterase